jgi:hypothetical protein
LITGDKADYTGSESESELESRSSIPLRITFEKSTVQNCAEHRETIVASEIETRREYVI